MHFHRSHFNTGAFMKYGFSFSFSFFYELMCAMRACDHAHISSCNTYIKRGVKPPMNPITTLNGIFSYAF